MKSFQNLALLQHLYRLKALGFEYVDPFVMNKKTNFEKPSNLYQLTQNISTCHLCDLSKSRKQSMSGYGSEFADLMIVDFSVSSAQDDTNDYYAGRSGESLKNMIVNVLELHVDDVYITHAIKCKPLHSNTPSSSEWNSCKNHLFSQFELVNPKVIVTLGAEAYHEITQDNSNFENVRGHVIEFGSRKLIPIYHPQYLLRNPELKKQTLGDLKTIKSCL